MKERLELVTQFSSLSAGMIVVVKGCIRCGKDDRGILTVRAPNKEPAWRIEPSCSGRQQCISVGCVGTGRVYRVVDGLEDPAEHERRRRALVEDAAAWGRAFERLGTTGRAR